MVIAAPTDGRDGTNPLDNARGESKREQVEETGGDCCSTTATDTDKNQNTTIKRSRGDNKKVSSSLLLFIQHLSSLILVFLSRKGRIQRVIEIKKMHSSCPLLLLVSSPSNLCFSYPQSPQRGRRSRRGWWRGQQKMALLIERNGIKKVSSPPLLLSCS